MTQNLKMYEMLHHIYRLCVTTFIDIKTEFLLRP